MGIFFSNPSDKRIAPGKEYKKATNDIYNNLHGSGSLKKEKLAAIEMGLDQALRDNPHGRVGIDSKEIAREVGDLQAHKKQLHLSDSEIKAVEQQLKKEL